MTTPETPAGLRLGHVPGVTLTKWRTRWAERLPGVPLHSVEVAEADQRRVLDDGTVDMCLVRLPVDAAGLHVIRLYDEVTVAWASKDHPLRAFDEVSLADLAGEVVLDVVDEAALEKVGFGDAVLVVPMSVARSHSLRELIYRPILDAPETTVALAWPADAEGPLLDEFVGIVRGRTANSSRTAQERRASEGSTEQGAEAQGGASKGGANHGANKPGSASGGRRPRPNESGRRPRPLPGRHAPRGRRGR